MMTEVYKPRHTEILATKSAAINLGNATQG